MKESIQVSGFLPVSPQKVYSAWLSSREHGAFTGSKAVIDPTIGGKFSAWDGYISGTTLELTPDKRILQKWRTTEFPENSEDSILEILLEEVPEGTKITINHTEIPERQSEDYKDGWINYYFEPMQIYFSRQK